MDKLLELTKSYFYQLARDTKLHHLDDSSFIWDKIDFINFKTKEFTENWDINSITEIYHAINQSNNVFFIVFESGDYVFLIDDLDTYLDKNNFIESSLVDFYNTILFTRKNIKNLKNISELEKMIY